MIYMNTDKVNSKNETKHFYFAYGSNMSTKEINDAIKISNEKAEVVGIGKIEGYRLDFTRYSSKRQGYVADVVKTPGSTVWGVVYKLSAQAFEFIDKKEGVSLRAYKRKTVDIHIQINAIISKIKSIIGKKVVPVRAILYTVVKKKTKPLKPPTAYSDIILKGAEEHKLPDDYIKNLNRYISSLASPRILSVAR